MTYTTRASRTETSNFARSIQIIYSDLFTAYHSRYMMHKAKPDGAQLAIDHLDPVTHCVFSWWHSSSQLLQVRACHICHQHITWQTTQWCTTQDKHNVDCVIIVISHTKKFQAIFWDIFQPRFSWSTNSVRVIWWRSEAVKKETMNPRTCILAYIVECHQWQRPGESNVFNVWSITMRRLRDSKMHETS